MRAPKSSRSGGLHLGRPDDPDDFLQELIDTGKVDIGRSADTNYIDRVRAKYFRDRDEHNFVATFGVTPDRTTPTPTTLTPKDAQPQVTLLPGGRTLSVQWKIREELFSELQAKAQGIASNSSRSISYSDTMQLMGYFRGTPQLIQLDVECTGNPKKVMWTGKAHMQFNCMYVCTLKVATDRHVLTSQPKNAGFADFGFLESSAEADRGGGGHGENSDGGGAAAAVGGAADDDGEGDGHRRRRNHHPRRTPDDNNHDLLSDLLSHNAYFDSIVNMIPARLYVSGSSSSSSSFGDNARYRKGQHAESKEARRGRNKRTKFDPDSVETTLETKRRVRMEAEAMEEGGEEVEGDDDNDEDDEDNDDENEDDDEKDGEDGTALTNTMIDDDDDDDESSTTKYASRIEALRAKLRARVAALSSGTRAGRVDDDVDVANDVADGSSSRSASSSSDPAAVSKRAARRAEKRRRAEEAARRRGGGRTGSSSSSSSSSSSTAPAPSATIPAAATVAEDLARIDYQSLAGLKPVPDGAFDNKSLSGGGGRNGSGGRGGKRQSLERLLADAERKQATRELKSRQGGGDARGRTTSDGANLRKTNDPALLKKALKRKAKKKSASAKAWNSRRKAKKKSASAKAWNSRVEKTKDAIAERQRIRSHNLDQRKLGGATAANLSSKRIVEGDAGEGVDGGKAEKRRRLGPHSNQGGNRAGFEGKKSGFINGKGGGGGEGRGGGASSSSSSSSAAAGGGVGKKGR
ncbi:hypothetical protein ACHAW5_003655 [Stephanodiscus triporus]|uniref:Ribosomal RNA-processing protein 14 N-terminal domain-containing protein n=1 Tax=Stephanodiscus triporus TaxID=2934178 RepID=A0ABD3NWT3_9STRA